jgi:hypothetical protein
MEKSISQQVDEIQPSNFVGTSPRMEQMLRKAKILSRDLPEGQSPHCGNDAR